MKRPSLRRAKRQWIIKPKHPALMKNGPHVQAVNNFAYDLKCVFKLEV